MTHRALDFPQNNPTLDKMSSRLGYAGAGDLSPILSGLPGRFTFEANTLHGETMDGVVIKCFDENMTAGTAKTWTGIVSTDETTAFVDVVFGNSSFTFTGTDPTRNILEWTTNVGTCRRQFWVMDSPTSRAVYIDNQETHDGLNPAKVFVDPTAGVNGGDGCATGETDATAYWDKNLTFSINVLPGISDEFFRQQEWWDRYKYGDASGNRYANTIRNWGGAKTVEVFLDADLSTPIIPETYVDYIHGYHWGPVSTGQLGTHFLTLKLRAKPGSSTAITLEAFFVINRFPCSL